jgi:hypothetical protein
MGRRLATFRRARRRVGRRTKSDVRQVALARVALLVILEVAFDVTFKMTCK